MQSPSRKNPSLRLIVGIPFVLALGLLVLLLQPGGPGYAAPPSAPDGAHRTATPTPTGGASVSTQSDDASVNPFIGFGSSTAYAMAIPDLCADTVVAPGGEAWVLSNSSFFIGDPDKLEGVVLYVQRCVGDFQPWDPVGSDSDTGVFQLLPPVIAFLPTPTPAVPIAQGLMLPVEAFQVFPTPVPLDRAPVLAPIFTGPLVPVVPTIEAPERFELMPVTSVVLRRSDNKEIVLENVGDFRPDLWRYYFPVDSPSGVYDLTLSSGGNTQTREISVQGAARIYSTDRRGQLEERFVEPSDAVITYADFESDREVVVMLYRVVETPNVGEYTETPMALIGTWQFLPGERPLRERLSQRLAPNIGPSYGTFVLLACYTDTCNQMPRIDIGSRRVIWPEMVLGTVYIEPDASVLILPDTLTPIRFAAGAIDALIELTLSDSSPAGYTISANAGQRMRVELDTPNVQVYALAPSGELLLPTGQGVGVWEFTLQESGQHRLILYGVEDGHMTVTIPPGSAPPSQPPTATPTQTATPTPIPTPIPTIGPDSETLRDSLLERLAAAGTPNDHPNIANALVEHLLAHLGDFDATGLGSATVVDALSQRDAGDRINGIVHRVWSDWSRDSANPLNDDPAGLSPFRGLVVRLVQGRIAKLSSQEQRAILSWLTRNENIRVWRENPNGVIGAINREIFP